MVNIIIPVYHSLQTLPKTLDSLVAQTKQMFLVTLSQDGDGENYKPIVDEYTRRGLHMFLLENDVNQGPGFARQRGLDADKMSQYIMFCDSDDMLMPRAVEVLTNEIEKGGYDIVKGSYLIEKADGSAEAIDPSNVPITWVHAVIYRASYLRDNNIRFSDKLKFNEDAYFNLVAFNCTPNKAYISEVLAIWRYNTNSITRADTIGFSIESSPEYIYSQVLGLLKIAELSEVVNPVAVAGTLINIYNAAMILVNYNKTELVDKVNGYLSLLTPNEKICNATKDFNFWMYVSNTLRATQIFGNDLVFFKVRFNDWIKGFIQ